MTSEELLELLKEHETVSSGVVARRIQLGAFEVNERIWPETGVYPAGVWPEAGSSHSEVEITLEVYLIEPSGNWNIIGQWSSPSLGEEMNLLEAVLLTIRDFDLHPYRTFLASLEESQEMMRERLGAPALERLVGEPLV